MPLNVMYSNNNPQEIIFSELLSEKKILEAFKTLLLSE